MALLPANKTSVRFFQLDLLRVFACYLVIQQHASEFFYIGDGGSVVRGDNTFWIGIITSIARSSVPLFVMISGYLLLPMRNSTSQFFKKRFTRVVYPFVAWCVLYALYYMVTRGDTFLQALRNILHIPINFGVEIGHLWYVYMLIGLYLIIPVISSWAAEASKKEMRAYLVLWGITTLLPYIHLLFPQVWGECFWNPTPAFYYFSGFVGYLLLGFYIKRFGALPLPHAAACFLTGYALTSAIFCLRIETAPSIPQLELSWGFCTANVALMTCGLFSLFMHIPGKLQGETAGLIQDISVKSYGIYLAHIILLNLFHELLHPMFGSTLTAVPVIALCTFTCTYAAISILGLLPYGKYWLGYDSRPAK